MSDSTKLRIDVLGRFRIRAGDEPVSSPVSSRGREILAALLLAEPSLSRERLAGLLWPESSDSQARTNLRRELHDLRRTLPDGPELLTSAGDGTQLLLTGAVSSDVRDFRTALTRAADTGADTHRATASLSAAAAAYTGDLLPDTYAEWIAPERERLREQARGALQGLAAALEQRGETAAAIAPARRLVELEPYDEISVRTLMRLQAAVGDRAAAIHSYHRCASALQRELDAEPDAATQALYHALLASPSNPSSGGAAPPETATRGTPEAAPFEGRTAAAAALRGAQESSVALGERSVLVLGVAGIGKSRLVEETVRSFERQGAVVASARAYAAEGQLAYAPVVEWLRSPGMRASLSSLAAPLRRELAPLLAELRVNDVHDPLLIGAPSGGPAFRQLRMFEAVAGVLLAPGRPVVLVLDDLQWCDEATLSVIHFLGRFRGGAPRLIVVTARPGELEDNAEALDLLRRWREGGTLSEVELPPLTREEIARLALRLASDPEEAMTEAAQQRLFTLSEGNPLFAIEALRLGGSGPEVADTLRPNGPGATGWLLSRSPRVRAVLHGRLSQLGPAALTLARCAAIIGRGFDYEVLLAVCDLPEVEVVWALDELWRRRIVRDSGERGYDFSHDALREAARATLRPAHARLLHRKVAQALEHVHGAALEGISASVASHYEQAGLRERAIDSYDRAANASSAVHAYGEAVRLLERALALVAGTPEGSERDHRELELLLRMAPLLRVASGHTAPRLTGAMERARTLSVRVNDPAAQFHALRHLWAARFVEGSLLVSLELAHELRSLAQDVPRLTAESRHAIAGPLTNIGMFPQAIEHFDASRAANQSGRAHTQRARFGADLATFTQAWEAHALWLSGFEDRALRSAAEAVRTAQALEHVYSEALAHAYAAVLHYMRREHTACGISADAAVAVCDRYGFAYYRHWGALLAAWSQADEDPDAAEQVMQAALASLDSEGARVRRPIYLAALAEVQAMGGRSDAARSTLELAVTLADHSAEHLWDPELARLSALVATTPGEGVRVARRAVTRAQEMGAHPLALRAAVTLAHLVDQHSSHDGAGSDTDINASEVRALLEETIAAMPQGSATEGSAAGGSGAGGSGAQERAEALVVLSHLH